MVWDGGICTPWCCESQDRGQQTVDCTPFPCCSFMVRGGKGGGLWASAMQGSERLLVEGSLSQSGRSAKCKGMQEEGT